MAVLTQKPHVFRHFSGQSRSGQWSGLGFPLGRQKGPKNNGFFEQIDLVSGRDQEQFNVLLELKQARAPPIDLTMPQRVAALRLFSDLEMKPTKEQT